MKKPNRLTTDVVAHELELLAAGANGGVVIIDEHSEWPTLPQFLSPAAMSSLAYAVMERWFSEDVTESIGLFRISDIEKWANFDTLAAAVVAERFRLDSIAKE